MLKISKTRGSNEGNLVTVDNVIQYVIKGQYYINMNDNGSNGILVIKWSSRDPCSNGMCNVIKDTVPPGSTDVCEGFWLPSSTNSDQ